MSLIDEMAAEGGRIIRMRQARKNRRHRKAKKHAAKLNRPNRATWVKFLGFEDYQSYLKSKLWQKIRKAVFCRDDKTCCVCGREANCVHHCRYDLKTMKGEALENLVCLCVGCHELIEFDNGQKNTLVQANQKLDRLRRQAARDESHQPAPARR